MTDFLKTMLAVICGFIVLHLVCGFFMLVMFGAMIATAGSGNGASIPEKGVLDLNLSKIELVEQANEDMPSFAALQKGLDTKPVAVRSLVKAIESAAADPAVQYILLRPDGVNAGMAHMEELRTALQEYRKSGKALIAYTQTPGNGSYYLASVADKVYMSSVKGGTYQLVGLSASLTFLKDLLDKLGVNVQLIRHGKYKSAGEMFVKNSSSAENREQNQVMINSAWKNISGAIASSREISEEQFNLMVDRLAFCFPEDFLEAGLVDELMDHEQLLDKLCMLAQVDDADDLELIPVTDYISARKAAVAAPKTTSVAIIYADGEISDGWDGDGICGDRFVSEIDKVRKDDSIKAVVLRVNSPGGSVSASDKIKSALALLDREKPLVASYGNYAASGGYWISCGCRKIYSDANTITGSIGVFSMLPEFSKVSKKIGVGIEAVNSNKHSDMFSLMRPLDAAELAYMQSSVEDIYDTFVNIVADGRNLAPSRVDQLAQGRVWIGSDAIGIGLVDEIGTLDDAVAYAASLAGLVSDEDYKVVEYPKPLTVAEQIMQALGASKEPSILSGTPFEAVGRAIKEGVRTEVVYARLPYSLEIR